VKMQIPGNKKLISLDSVALFGLIAALSGLGALLTHKFQSEKDDYINSFQLVNNIPVIGLDYFEGCSDPTNALCLGGFNFTVFVNCSTNYPICPTDVSLTEPLISGNDTWWVIPVELEFDDMDSWNTTLFSNFFDLIQYNKNGQSGPPPQLLTAGYISSENSQDFRLLFTPACYGFCSDTKWMFVLCIVVFGMCITLSGFVFLYLYLRPILEYLNPQRRLDRLANLIMMRGEEPPKLDRPQTSSKSESIKPDLKEY